MSQRVILRSEVKPIGVAEAKASLKRANELREIDPKPGDLSMARVKRE